MMNERQIQSLRFVKNELSDDRVPLKIILQTVIDTDIPSIDIRIKKKIHSFFNAIRSKIYSFVESLQPIKYPLQTRKFELCERCQKQTKVTRIHKLRVSRIVETQCYSCLAHERKLSFEK